MKVISPKIEVISAKKTLYSNLFMSLSYL